MEPSIPRNQRTSGQVAKATANMAIERRRCRGRRSGEPSSTTMTSTSGAFASSAERTAAAMWRSVLYAGITTGTRGAQDAVCGRLIADLTTPANQRTEEGANPTHIGVRYKGLQERRGRPEALAATAILITNSGQVFGNLSVKLPEVASGLPPGLFVPEYRDAIPGGPHSWLVGETSG